LENALTFHTIVDPSQIESNLVHLWDTLAKEGKTRASLFNLIVYNELSDRTDYFRNVVQKIVEKFPCRIIFISFDSKASHPYLKTAISVVIPSQEQTTIACDQIDIGVGSDDLHKVPSLLLPHLIPDLPVYLLWTQDPSSECPLFKPLSELAHRIIFDSESAENFYQFAQTVLKIKKSSNIDVADLNWARTEGWRNLIVSIFNSPERVEELKRLSFLKILYNAQETQFFSHLKVQSMYLLSWLASRLSWKMQPLSDSSIQMGPAKVTIESAQMKKLAPGTVIGMDFHTSNHLLFETARLPEFYHHVKIQISSPELCELPYQFILGQTASGQSLIQEIGTQGTSAHYLGALQMLTSVRGIC
jgi:glucose-6-phosphate dehydrogenase assembly protein OpcA